MKMKPVTTKAA